MATKSSIERDNVILVLQGGGALGAYQAGVFEALSENGFTPGWIAGISIGAINGAIIAGNRPEDRVARLRQFWDRVSSGVLGIPLIGDGHQRTLFNEASAFSSLAFGVNGFFTPRFPAPVFMAADGPESVSYYSTEPLAETLNELVDFDLLNRDGPRLSVGAVNIATGNLQFFDKDKEKLTAAHVMASGALPPGLPAVKIGRDYYWDGGLVSNTPLQYVLDETADPRKFIFQVDLFSARGVIPGNLLEAAEREKEIRYSSRTRFNTDMAAKRIEYRAALARLLRKLPAALQGDADAKLLAEIGEEPAVTIVHLILRDRAYETQARDYEFSRVSVNEHWEQGRRDVLTTLAHDEFKTCLAQKPGVTVLDLTRKSANTASQGVAS